MKNPLQPKYNRVEIVADLGFGNRVVLFADFSSKGISAGILRHVKIMKGSPEEPIEKPAIDETQRTTVHANGSVVTHWPLPSGKVFKAPWEIRRLPLRSWGSPVTQKEELYWSSEHRLFLQKYLVPPKTSPRTLSIVARFKPGFQESVATYTVVKPSGLAAFMSGIPDEVQAWSIIGGWPYVVLTLSNTVNLGRRVIADAGRDYR
jgi:hypothetical protein